MKRLYSLLLCMVMIVFSVAGYYMPVMAQNSVSNTKESFDKTNDALANQYVFYDSYKGSSDSWVNDFDYDIMENNIILKNYHGSASDLSIPSTAVIDGETYTVKLNDECYYFFSSGQSLRTVRFGNVDTSNVTNMSGMFSSCSGLTSVDLSTFNTSNVVSMSNMFAGCSSLTNLDLSSFDTHNVKDMSGMFGGCESLTNLNIKGFNTSKVEDMSAMFCSCTNLVNLDVSSFDTSNVKYMFDMFSYSGISRIDMSRWNLRNLQYKTTEYHTQDYKSMFAQCFKLAEIKTPINLSVDVPLYYSFSQQDNPGVQYTSLPMNQSGSITLINNISYVPVTGVSITPTTKTIKVGETFRIDVNLIPDNASNYNFYVTSSNPAVANVEYGHYDYYIAGTGEGTAVITCKTEEGGFTADCVVTVEGEVNKEPKQVYDYSWEVLELVNQERTKVGAAPLVMDKGMLNMARLRAEELIILYSHKRPDGTYCETALPNGYKNSVEFGENIAKGQKTPSEVVNSWMNSPGHRQNMLDKNYKSIGIGCVYVSGFLSNEYYWVQDFYGEAVEPILKGGVPTSPVTTTDGTIPMYRMYNPNSGEHFYTSNYSEIVNLGQAGWQYEDVAWYAPENGDEVYRLYNSNAGDHHYTLNSVERDMLITAGWSYEGVSWKSSGEVPLYRVYNPNAQTGSHHYTTSQAEFNNLVSVGWRDEGIAWYAIK